MKYWAVMEFFTPETTDRFGVASFVESGEEVIDVVSGDPLKDIHNMEKVVFVMKNGVVIGGGSSFPCR